MADNQRKNNPQPLSPLDGNNPLAYKSIREQLLIKDRAIASSIHGIGIGDLEGNITYVNDAALKMWGADDPSEVVGQSVLDFAQDPDEALAVMHKVLTEGSWAGEIAGKRKDGSPIIVYLSANLVYNDKGEPICTMDSFIDITARKKIEEDLRLKECAIASSAYGIAMGDLSGNITYVNNAVMKIWGTENPSEILGRNALDLARSKKEAIAVLSAVIKQGSWEGEIEGIRKDGTPVTTILSASLVYNEHAEPVCIMVSLIDITARKKIEEELRIKEFAIASSIYGIGIGDLAGNVTYVNDAALKMWGAAERSEVIGRSSLEFAKSKTEALEVMHAVLENGSWEGEIAGVRKDGTPIILHLSANLVYNEQGEPVCTMDSFIDVTEKKKIEEELRIKEFAIASSINSIVIGDLSGNITYVNNAFLRLWGTDDPSEVIGKPAISFAKDPKQAEAILAEILESGSWFGEIEGVRKDGRSLPVQLSANVVTDTNHQPVCLMCSFVDITDRKNAESALEKANLDLENRVAERTQDLVTANEQLVRQIEERKQVETSLRQKEEELRQNSMNLEETNTALKILLKQREQDKEELEEKVLANVKELVMPYIEKLKSCQMDTKGKTYLEILESNVEDIVSPYLKKLSACYQNFTPMQIQVADMVKAGKSTKEISELLNISDRAVEFHRNNIRNKLGLKNRKLNLRSYLLSLG
ncbi:MAG: PAS domain S-box protein [Thermodesulfobacteriota bacterium]